MRIDLLGLGSVAVDELLYLADYPPPDAKVPIVRRLRRVGGQTGNALIAAARLGVRCAYAGVLGDDADARFVLDGLQAEGVDISHRAFRAGTKPIRSTILVEVGSGRRSVLFDLEGCAPAAVDAPPEDVIRAARVLYVDQFGVEGIIRSARIARAAGAAVVADLEAINQPQVGELLPLVDHLILAKNVAAELTGVNEPAAMVEKLWTPHRQLVAVTHGAAGCWYRGRDGQFAHQSAIAVDAKDTTGCGDVFRAAYAVGLVRGWDLPVRMKLAATAAGLRARDGDSPTLVQVDSLMSK